MSPSIGCRKRRRRWITLVSIRIRQVVLLGYRISYLSIPWCARSRPGGRRHYRAFKATFLQLSSDLFHPEAVMRVVIADLRGRSGFVNKDTVVGGYGSR